MSDYLKTMNLAEKQIDDISIQLDAISRAFYLTGNTVMGDTLGFMSVDLKYSGESIGEAVRKEIRSTCDASHKSAANTVMACLAMSQLNKDKDLTVNE